MLPWFASRLPGSMMLGGTRMKDFIAQFARLRNTDRVSLSSKKLPRWRFRYPWYVPEALESAPQVHRRLSMDRRAGVTVLQWRHHVCRSAPARSSSLTAAVGRSSQKTSDLLLTALTGAWHRSRCMPPPGPCTRRPFRLLPTSLSVPTCVMGYSVRQTPSPGSKMYTDIVAASSEAVVEGFVRHMHSLTYKKCPRL
ncbi:hypothetical protein BC834DRAFT_634306 [Gloeopeniophorella convolvens]|nr:hypothetical protein BC834DRAFT_634306 [Gloeopeniophorella convolvens]